MRILIFNTTILTSPGNWNNKELTLEEAKKIVLANQDVIVSGIGHESTSKLLTTLFGVEIPVNRIPLKQTQDDIAICFKLKGRIPEGQVLDLKQIKELGYEFFRIKAL
ncbi:MAG: STIV orfB116 family protein [Cetobacterium sp.]